MDFSTWVTRLSNFFTVFYGFAFAMESLCTSLCVVFCHGHLHLDKRGILKKILYVVILFLLSNVLCMLAYSLFSEFAATAIIFALLLPGAVFLIIKDHGGVFQRIIKMTLFFSSTYVVTEIGHRVNIMVSMISNSFSRELLMSLPYLTLILSGFLVGYFNINRFKEIPLSYFILNISLFIGILLITFLQSSFRTGEDGQLTSLFLILVLFVLLAIDLGIYIMLYKFLEKQEKLLIAEAECKLNEASKVMLKLNEESIARSSLVRHDLKNHYAYVKSLLEEGKDKEALSFVSNALDASFEDIHIIDCGNTLVSSIMNLEMSKARVNHTELKYMIAVPPSLPFEDYDLCSLLSNLIDNAMEEVLRCSKKGYVDAKIKKDGSYLRIVVTNPSDKTNLDFTTAKKKEGHGYGISIIKNIVSKYNGHVSFFLQDGTFTADCILDMTYRKETDHDQDCHA